MSSLPNRGWFGRLARALSSTLPTETVKYSTADVPQQASVKAWEEFLEEIYYGHRVRSTTGDLISGSIESCNFADVSVSGHRATAHRISRTKDLIAADRAEQYAFVFPRSGIFECRQRGRQVFAAAGDMYILNASEPFEVETSQHASSYAIIIPSNTCRLVFNNIEDQFCRANLGEKALTGAIRGLIGGILRAKSQTEDRCLRDTLFGLLEVTINPRYRVTNDVSVSAKDAARHLLIDMVRRIIRERLYDSDFSIVEAAESCRVSVRHLQSVFQQIGSTFREELLDARLLRASELLRSSSRGLRRVGQISAECGFQSQAHFSTSYKARFGIRPKDEDPS